MSDALSALREHLGTITDLEKAADVLSWDQETFMPPGGAEARAKQLSTLQSISHDRLTSEKTGDLLDAAAEALNGSPNALDADSLNADAALVRVARRDYEQARRLPTSLVRRLSEAVSRAKEAWKAARRDDDFGTFAPHLQTLVDLNIEKANALGFDDEPYDALLDIYEPGMSTAEVEATFSALRDDLVPLVDAIADAEPLDDAVLHRTYSQPAQKEFGETVIGELGYDFNRGRQDVSAHPFTTSFDVDDVRLTTRYSETDFSTAFYSMLHEAGHGIYEQGIDPDFARTPLAEGASLGVHESQSRLYENLVGRSRAFWTYYLPVARQHFPDALDDVSVDAFYRAVNRVEPSLIRVEADEVTYSLHVMLRFELERGLIDGRIDVEDLPALWNEKMDAFLGVVPNTDTEGVLQDVHWALGAFGYFPTYALGSLLSAQIFEAAGRDLPDLDDQLAAGDTQPLLDWLRTHVHRHGRALQAPDLVKRATGQPLTPAPWLRYVREKFGSLYGI